MCYNDSYCFIISWGCGLIIFNISQRVHYALPNRVYLLHNSRQAFLKRAMYIFPLSELSAINNFHYHLQCKGQIIFFYLRIFFSNKIYARLLNLLCLSFIIKLRQMLSILPCQIKFKILFCKSLLTFISVFFIRFNRHVLYFN